MIRQIFVETKKKYDTTLDALAHEIHTQTNAGFEGLRCINRYDVAGVDSDDDWQSCVTSVFSDAQTDRAYHELPELDGFMLAVRLLAGQFDQRADSAAACVRALLDRDDIIVEASRIYIFSGGLTDADKQSIRRFLINPVESVEIPLGLPAQIGFAAACPQPVPVVSGFADMDDPAVFDLHTQMGLAMRREDLCFCRDYFRQEGRNPTLTELKVIDTYWSDHCRHTTFTTELSEVVFEDGPYKNIFEQAFALYKAERDPHKPITLMDLATTAMKSLKKRGLLNDLDESEEINACSILIDVDVDGQNEEWILQFKNETHNHPTEIEPYGGASTCLGGAIRDPLAGRAYVYQAMRVTGSGDPTVPFGETLPGKLAQKTITTLAAKGYSDYGNQIGLASGHGAEIYHEGYRAKRMELGAVVGAVKRDHVRRLSPQGEDVVLLVGGRTGRDGCGGATGSSVGHTEASQAQGGAEVQKGNPLIERNLQRLFRSPEAAKRIKRCNDFGAGGISVAVGELADGLDINLDAVPTKYDGLNGTELAISESQERMAVVVSPEDVSAFTALASAENLECTPIAVVNDSGRMTMRYRGDVVVDIARSFLNSSGAKRGIKVNVTSYVDRAAYKDWQDWLLHLKQLNVACQKGLAERFDATVGAGTVLVPFVGKHRLTPSQVMAAKIPVDGETETASLMAYGFDPYLSENSPFHGAVSAIVESVAKIVAVGGAYPQARLSLQEYFERLDDDPHRWQKPFLALLGAFWVQMALELPAIGGKDSMSGSFEATDPNGVVRRVDVPPTLVSFCVQTAKTPGLISQDLKSTDSHLVYLHAKYDGYHLPDFKYLKSSFNRVTQLIKSGHIKAAYALDAGGLASALTKMALGNGIGACVSGNNWFSADAGSFLLEMTDKPTALLAGLEYEVLGKTVSDPALTVNEKRIPLADCHDAWLSTLEPIFPTGLLKPKPETVTVIPFYTRKQMGTPGFGIAKPRVFMPLFSGTNAEYETTRAFEKKGGQVEAYVIRSLRAEALNESLIHMEKQLGQAQILMLCGGFGAGDEPDGSGKYMAALLTKPRILQAIQELLRRDGLVLGIGNGFQALVRSGFLTSFSLTQNSIGRHVSDLVMTKIISSHSPWLWNTQPGDVHLLPVSHGQGRFMAGDEEMKNMINSGLIAAQYVDFAGQPSMDIRFNPSGSMYAVEAVASPDGRILGKLAHSERVGDGLYKGFDMNMEQGIFAAGVGYYR